MNNIKESYIDHWDKKFSTGSWGKYPPEELVRFVGRNYKELKRSNFKVLEVGCGPGANLWFLHREGYCVAGIDGAPFAIEQARQRIEKENKSLNHLAPDLKVGNFSILPWGDESFDLVIDIFSVYANTIDIIEKTLLEVSRVLKPGGSFFCKLWGTETTGFGEGKEIERYTFDNLTNGPCGNMGMTHFFDRDEIKNVYSRFDIRSIDRILRTDDHSDSIIEEFVCVFQKKRNDSK